MPKLPTIFRFVVMSAAAVAAFEGWQHYGPTTQQLKLIATRALEVAHGSLNNAQLKPAETKLAECQAAEAPGFLPMPAAIPGDAPPLIGKDEFPAAPSILAADAAAEAAQAAAVKPTVRSATEADHLAGLMTRLHDLGGVDPQLVEWGGSGQLYRFCCQAATSDAPNLKRHFESVAARPEVAVKDVLGKVEAWRAQERDRSRLR